MERCAARLGAAAPPAAMALRKGGDLGRLRGGAVTRAVVARRRRTARVGTVRCAAGEDAMGGDPRVQQMLVEMVQIQLGKTRMNDFVDERSEYMRSIADEAQREYNRIAMRTMKGLDDTGSRVLRQLDQDAYDIERELRTARAEMEAHQKEFEEYQQQSTYSRNEGLFFKNLYASPRSLRKKSTVYKPTYKKEVTILAATPSRDFSTSYRQILYGGLSLVIVSFMWSSSSALLAGTMMRPSKLAAYGVILAILVAQLANVKTLTGELEQDSSRSNGRLKDMSTVADPLLQEGSSDSEPPS